MSNCNLHSLFDFNSFLDLNIGDFMSEEVSFFYKP